MLTLFRGKLELTTHELMGGLFLPFMPLGKVALDGSKACTVFHSAGRFDKRCTWAAVTGVTVSGSALVQAYTLRYLKAQSLDT